MDWQSAKRRVLYFVCLFGAIFGLWLAAIFTRGRQSPAFEALRQGFSVLPFFAMLATRLLTRDHSSWHFSLRVWTRPALWAFCAIIPGVLIALGAVLYFSLYPQQFSGVFDYGRLLAKIGISRSGTVRLGAPVTFCLLSVLACALCIPLQLLALGEELGWRGYLLPMQTRSHSLRFAVLLNSFFWGLSHLPLALFGLLYGPSNPGLPWSGLFPMFLQYLALGVICCYVTITGGNCMYAAIVSGVVRAAGVLPVLLLARQENGLLGPNPSGLISMAGLLLCAAVLFLRLEKVQNRLIPQNQEENE